jgi:NADH:ubiquinone oxidoreductase subunit E
MNEQLSKAITKLGELPEDRQQQAALLLLDFIEQEENGIELTPEQIAEVEEALSDDEPFATEAEAKAFFDRLKK